MKFTIIQFNIGGWEKGSFEKIIIILKKKKGIKSGNFSNDAQSHHINQKEIPVELYGFKF